MINFIVITRLYFNQTDRPNQTTREDRPVNKTREERGRFRSYT